MAFPLSARIAWRYLRSKKSHSAVGVITGVSVAGIAVATAAIICVLSVFNGFRQILGTQLDQMAPDILVEPRQGKAIPGADSIALELSGIPGVDVATPTIIDNALLIFNSQEMPVFLKGVVPADYARITRTRSMISKDEGRYLEAGLPEGMPETVLSIGVASRLRAFPGDHLLLFAPKRHGKVSMANPLSSFLMDSLNVAGVYRANQNEYDDSRLIVDLPTVRRLLQYTDEASAIEIGLKPGAHLPDVMDAVEKSLGAGFIIKDRARQQEINFRMVEIEKWVSFLLMGFILLIASFNIISSLSMLVLEKEHNLGTLAAMGMRRRRVGAIFAWESVWVTLVGGVAGILLGIILCLLQQHYGLIRLGDGTNTLIDSYPVQLQGLDILYTFVPLILIGAAAAWTASAFARRRLRSKA